MPVYLDTSVLVRYITADPHEMALRAAQLIDSDDPLVITETALNETAYVLRRVYGLTREETVDVLIEVLHRSNIHFQPLDKLLVIDALRMCRPSGRVSFGDALIWAAAHAAPPSAVFSFDRRFPAEGIELRQP